MDKKAPIILITGFAPFGSVVKNPSWQITRQIRQDNIYHACLPVDYELAPRLLLYKIRQIKPDIVVGSGIHFGVDFTLEAWAGRTGVIDKKRLLPWPYYLPAMTSIAAIMAKTCPTKVSYNAGEYVCEWIAFWIARLAKHYRYCGGFVHVPPLHIASATVQKRWWHKFITIMTEAHQ